VVVPTYARRHRTMEQATRVAALWCDHWCVGRAGGARFGRKVARKSALRNSIVGDPAEYADAFALEERMSRHGALRYARIIL